jgi:ankyrin repeat protein
LETRHIPFTGSPWLSVVLIFVMLSWAGISGAAATVDDQLMEASKRGDMRLVKTTLEKGAAVNAVDKGGATALIHAADRGHVKVVGLLLEKGADVNAKDKGGWTALMWAATGSSSRRTEMVKLLIAKGAEVNAKDQTGATALMGCSRQGNLRAVKLLLEKGTDVNAKDREGASALIEASTNGHLDIVKLLLEKGADVNAKDNEGKTPLMRASEKGHSKVANLLEGHRAAPPGSPDRTIEANLLDTWELLSQVDENGNQERPKEGTRTLMEFTDKGQLILSRVDKDNSDKMKTRTGKYALDRNVISITDDVGNTVRWPYQISGDTIVIDMPEVKKKFYWGRFR